MRPIDKPVVPPGYHSMPDGTSMKGSTHGGGSATNPFENLLRAVNPLARRNDVSSSLMGPAATTLANANAPFTTGAIAERGNAGLGDVAKDLGMYAAGGLIGKAVGAGALAAGNYATKSNRLYDSLINVDVSPATTARMLALTNKLFHGKQGTSSGKMINSSEPAPFSFDVLPKAPRNYQNWFDGDFFATPSKKLARSYGDVYSANSVPENLRVLDLMPGGPSIAAQNPKLAEFLSRVFGPEEVASSMTRHKPYTDEMLFNPNDPGAVGSMSKILKDYGYNALRHISGQGVGTKRVAEEPVYVFFNPENMRAESILRHLKTTR